MKKTLSLSSAILYFFSLYVNFLAGTGKLNSISTGEVSAIYPTLFTPAGITFSIWGLIFLLNTLFVSAQIYLAFRSPKAFDIKLNLTFMGISLISIAWLWLWHHRQIGLALMVIVLYLIAVLFCYQRVFKPKRRTRINTFAFVNFGVYAGWLSVATIANTAVALTTIGVSPSGLSAVVSVGMVFIVIISLAYFFLFYHRNVWSPLVYAWATFGIYLSSSSNPLDGAAFVHQLSMGLLFLLLLGVLIIVIRFIKRKWSS